MGDGVEITDVAEGLWIWQMRHPAWLPGNDWEPQIAATCVRSGGEVAVVDGLLPAEGGAVQDRLDATPPTLAVVLKPDHVRSVDEIVRRYGARPFGPNLFWRDDVPQTELEPLEPGVRLPGGMEALYDGRGRNETPLWVPERRALIFADALTAPDGVLRVWATPWHLQRAVPALRALLDLPFELVIVSHGCPVHDRAEYERALVRPPYTG
jgi:glyoxylase-like metal-dependent hydrolase (beta-lactamase superfamily II)